MGSQGKYDQALKELLQMPEFTQGYGMAKALGKDMSGYIVEGKEGKKNKMSDPTSWMKLGNGQWFNIGQFMTDMPQLGKEFQAKQAADYQESIKTLAGTPGWSQVYKESQGQFDPQFTASVDQAFGQMGSYAMGGGGVNSGFASDPVKQNAMLGPAALQKAMYLKQIQQMSQDKIMGAAGGYGISPIQSYYTPQTASSYIPALQQSLASWQQNNQFGQQIGLQNKGMLYDLYGAGAGALGMAFT